MTIEYEIRDQCRLIRERDWLDLLARVYDWTREPDVDAEELDARERLRDRLDRVWRNLGSPRSRVRWPSDITLADVQLRDVYFPFPSSIDAADSPKDVAKIWWERYVPVGSTSHLIERTQWLPLVGQLVHVWTHYPGRKGIVVLAHDGNDTPQLWLELNESGIRKLQDLDAA